MYDSMKDAGYRHISSSGNGGHILKNLETGNSEMWFCNKYHASYGIKYKNTHLEFAHSLPY